MPHAKSFKTLFVEAVMFISVFALLSHVAVNFWERYVIQRELIKMKSSLYNLKGTVNNIGFAYDHLHDELKTLVVLADNSHPSEQESFEENKRKNRTFLDAYMQSSFMNAEKDINVKPSIRNISQQISTLHTNIPKTYRNVTTLKIPLTRNANIQKCSHVPASLYKSRHNQIDKYVGLAFPLKDHVQHTSKSDDKIADKEVGTRTTLPLKSTGVTTKPEYPIRKTKARPVYVRKSGRNSVSRYQEEWAHCYQRY